MWKNKLVQFLPRKAADLFAYETSLCQHKMVATYKEHQSQWGRQELQPCLTFRAATSSQSASAIPAVDVLPPYAEMTLWDHLHASYRWLWYKWRIIKGALRQKFCLVGLTGSLFQDKIHAGVVTAARVQELIYLQMVKLWGEPTPGRLSTVLLTSKLITSWYEDAV